MIIEHRTYTVHPGKLSAQLRLYEEHGFAVQKRYLGAPLAFLVTEIGDVNSYIHLWVYENSEDRERRRAQLAADLDWQAYLAKSSCAGHIAKQETKLLKPAGFAPLQKWNDASDAMERPISDIDDCRQ
ncbi:MAG TPA: NIPSNAP family protein [Afipia sp.]